MKHKRSEPSHNKTKKSRTRRYFCQYRSLNSREGQVGIPGSFAWRGELGLQSSLATSCVLLPIIARVAPSPRGKSGYISQEHTAFCKATVHSTPHICQQGLPSLAECPRPRSPSPHGPGQYQGGLKIPGGGAKSALWIFPSNAQVHHRDIHTTQFSNQQPKCKHPPNTGFMGKPYGHHGRCCQAMNATQ